MNTEPKITQEHLDAAADQMSGYELMLDFVNKVIEIALAEQQEGEYITAAQARELGVGNAEIRNAFGDWVICQGNIYGYPNDAKYRAIKQAQPEPVEQWQENDNSRGFDKLAEKQSPELLIPVDPHATLRAEYIRQRDAVPCELGFYEWEYRTKENEQWRLIEALLGTFYDYYQYRCTDISCYVSKDGDTAIRMLRTDAQELQAKTRDECDWFTPFSSQLDVDDDFFSFCSNGTYTYRTKATIKLDGNMLTPEQAEAEWKAKKETHDVWASFRGDDYLKVIYAGFLLADYPATYELRLKQPTWTGSREDVIALLKEMGGAMTTTYVCSYKDIECGSKPENWCSKCPLKLRTNEPKGAL